MWIRKIKAGGRILIQDAFYAHEALLPYVGVFVRVDDKGIVDTQIRDELVTLCQLDLTKPAETFDTYFAAVKALLPKQRILGKADRDTITIAYRDAVSADVTAAELTHQYEQRVGGDYGFLEEMATLLVKSTDIRARDVGFLLMTLLASFRIGDPAFKVQLMRLTEQYFIDVVQPWASEGGIK